MMQGRALAPYPPTNVTFNGQVFPATLSNSGPVNVAWKRRNRQNGTILFPANGDEEPEPGTEYFVAHEGVVENLGTGTSGSFYFLGDGDHVVEMFARCNGRDSNRVVFNTTVTGSAAPPGAAPSAPSALVGRGGNLQNHLDWEPSTGSPLGYSVYGKQGGAGGFPEASLIGSTRSSDFIHRGVSAGAAWRYWVVGYNGSGVSAPSNEATATAFSEGSGNSYTGTGDPETPGEEGDSYTDTSQVPPVPWIYVGGTWVRQTTYDIAMMWAGSPPSIKRFWKFQAVRRFILPSGLTGSQLSVATKPMSGTVVLELRKNEGVIGTLSFSTSSFDAVVDFPGSVTFEENDELSLTTPLDMNGLRDIFITFSAYR